ncbi:MAG: hypothetical protein P8J33_01470, partial [Pirellulaceae bacterium]|nr:hypothetical protein [Pirellulaceae bacterium]
MHSRNFQPPESAALLDDGGAAMMLVPSGKEVGIIHYALETWSEAAELAEFRDGGFMRSLHNPATAGWWNPDS